MKTVTVVSGSLNKKGLTLYLKDGSSLYIPQEDSRLKLYSYAILELETKDSIELILTDEEDSVFTKFEKKSNKFVRFFKTIKDNIINIFSKESSKTETFRKIESVLSNSLNSTEFKTVNPEETIIAITEDNTIIPGIENIIPLINASVDSDNITGLSKFFERMAIIQDKTPHTAQELLKFLEKGDLPIADDGSIIAYKLVFKEKDYFVDCHTRKVKQNIGSIISMDPSLVDPNRRIECSAGFHIARRDYLKSMYGDTILLVKFNPEDVVAVPIYEPSKIRVSSYKVIDVFPDNMFLDIKNGISITKIPGTKEIIARALSLKEGASSETVTVSKPMGEGVSTSPVETPPDEAPKAPEEINTEDLAKVVPVENKEIGTKAPIVNPSEISKLIKPPTMKQYWDKVQAIKSKKPNKERKDLLLKMIEMKKKSRKSWAKYNISSEIIEKLIDLEQISR